MKRYLDNQVQKIIELRQAKRYSYESLGRLTNIPASTIRNWCTSIDEGTKWDTLIASNERRRQEYRISEAHVVDKMDIEDKEKAKLFAALLYWCEGSKYPSSTAVTMVNSDPDLMRTFIYLLRTGFAPDESKFHVHVQIHDTHDFKLIRKYWSELLHVPQSQFIKPTVTKPRGGKHRKEYWGTCTLKYQDYRLLLKLMGIYESFARKIIV